MTSIREQCARALFDKRTREYGMSWNDLEQPDKDAYMEDIDAVLDVLMEPTPGMRAIGQQEVAFVADAGSFEIMATGAWQAILDHVRKGGE